MGDPYRTTAAPSALENEELEKDRLTAIRRHASKLINEWWTAKQAEHRRKQQNEREPDA